MRGGRVGAGLAACCLGVVLVGGALEGTAWLLEFRSAAGGVTEAAAGIEHANRIFLPTLEFALPGLVQRDPQLGYRLRPGAASGPNDYMPYAINGQGFRGPEAAIPKPAGAFRVVVLGGSTTFGWGVEQKQAYPAALERLLAARCTPQLGDRVEVLNGGVPGYISTQNARQLELTWARYQPDLVLVMDGLNDLFAVPLLEPTGAGPNAPHPLVRSRLQQRLLSVAAWTLTHSALARAMDRAIRSARPRRRSAATPSARHELPSHPSAASPAPAITVLQASLERMRRLTQRHGSRLAILVYPGEINNWTERSWTLLPEAVRPPTSLSFGVGRFEPVAEAMAAWARRRDVPVVDLRPVFAGRADGLSLFLPDGQHFTPQGNTLVAEAIYEQLFRARCGS